MLTAYADGRRSGLQHSLLLSASWSAMLATTEDKCINFDDLDNYLPLRPGRARVPSFALPGGVLHEPGQSGGAPFYSKIKKNNDHLRQ